MRKGFIYSLAALAAMPLAGNATVISGSTITGAVVNSNWAGATKISKDTVTWSKGEISLDLGSRVAGNYTFNLTIANPDGEVTVNIGGQSVTYDPMASQEKWISFTLTETKDVTVKITPAVAGKTYKIYGAALIFDASNFDDPIATLEKLAATVSYNIKNTYSYDATDRNNDQISLGVLVQKIDAIKTSKTYEDYVNNNLATVATCDLAKQINAIGTAAATKQKEYDNDQAYKTAVSNIESLTINSYTYLKLDSIVSKSSDKLVQASFAAIKSSVEQFKSDALAEFNAKTAAAFDYKLTGKRLTAISDSINVLSKKVSTVLGFYDDIMKQVAYRKNKYNGVQNQLVQVLRGTPYSKWLTAAQNELDALAVQINKVEKWSKAAYDANTLKEEDVNNEINALPTLAQFDAIITKYVTPAQELQSLYESNTKKVDDLKKALAEIVPNDFLKNDATRIGSYNTKNTAISNLIKTLANDVETANNNNTKLDISARVTANTDSINTLKAFVDAENVLYDFNGSTYAEAKKTVNTYISKDNVYNGGKMWPATETTDKTNSIVSLITAAEKVADGILKGTAYTEFKADTTAIRTKITGYLTDAKGALAKYEEAHNNSLRYDTVITKISDKLNANSTVAGADPGEYGGTTGDFSYNATLLTLKNKKKAYDDNITAALKLKDQKHYTALKNIGTDDTLEKYTGTALTTYLAGIDASQAAFNKTLQLKQRNALDTVVSDKLKAVDALLDSLDQVNATTASATYGTEFITALQADYKEKKAAVASCQTIYDNNWDQKDVDDTYTKVIANLTSASLKLDTITGEINKSLAHADSCLKNKKAYDDDYHDMVQTLTSQINDAKKGLETTAANVKDDQKFTDEWAAIETLVNPLDSTTLASYKKIALVDEWKSTLKAQYDALVKRIADNVTAAKAEQANYTKSEASYAKLLVLEQKVTDAIAKAKTECATEDPDAGITYYANTVLGDKGYYKTQYDKLATGITAKRKVRNCQSIESTYTPQLQELVDSIVKEPGKAKNNLSIYNDPVKVYENDIQTRWNEVSYIISSTDESSMKATYQAQLKEIKDLDMVQYNQSALDIYHTGGFAIKNNGNLTTMETKKTELIVKINNVLATQQKGYNAAIQADNQSRYNDFNIMLGQAEQSFVNYVDTINIYKSLKTKTLQNVVETIYNKSTGLNTNLFGGVYTQKMNELKNRADSVFKVAQATAGMIYDSDKATPAGFYKEANTLKKDLDALFSTFKSDVLTEAKSVWTSLDCDNKLDTAKQDLVDLKLPQTYRNNAFADIEKYINQANSALKSADQLDLANLDKAMVYLVDIDSLLMVQKNTASASYIDYLIQSANTVYKNDISTINGLNVAQNTKDKFLADYEENTKKTLRAAEKKRNASTSVFTDYKVIKDSVDGFLSYHYSKVTTLINDQKTENEVVAPLYAGLESSLSLAVDTISRYYIAEQFQSAILTLTDTLQANKENATTSYLMTGVAPKAAAKAFKAYFDAQLSALVDRATTTEFTHLKGDINVLNAEFLKLTQTQRDANTALQTEIANITADLNKVDLTAKTAPDALVSLEARVAAARTTLATINPAPAYATILTNLNQQLTDLATKAKLADYTDYVKGQVKDESITVKGDITTEQQYLTKVSGSVVYYQEKVQNKIDLLSAEVNALIANADKAKKVQDASDKLADAVQAKIDDFAQSEKDAKAKIDENTFWKASNYASDWTDIEGQISTMNQDLATMKANVKLTSSTFDDALLKTLNTKLQNILDDAAYNELTKSVSDKYTKVQRVEAVYNSRTYSTAKQTEYTKAIADIRADITDNVDNAIDRLNWNDANLSTYKKVLTTVQDSIGSLTSKLNANQLGDFDNNGSVDVFDFNTLIDYVVGNKTLPDVTSKEFVSLDLNGDQKLDIADAVKLVNLTQNPAKDPLTSPANAYLPNVTESLSMQTVSESNNVTRVAINLTNARAYVAYQMDVKLPSNMKLVGQSLTSRANNHDIFTGEVDGSTRIAVASLANNAFTGAEGAVLYLDIETVGNFDASQIEFSNIIFATRDAQEFEMSLGGQTTGINSVGTAESLKAKIYNVGGKLMNQIKKGINIIRNSDGSTQKVIKK